MSRHVRRGLYRDPLRDRAPGRAVLEAHQHASAERLPATLGRLADGSEHQRGRLTIGKHRDAATHIAQPLRLGANAALAPAQFLALGRYHARHQAQGLGCGKKRDNDGDADQEKQHDQQREHELKGGLPRFIPWGAADGGFQSPVLRRIAGVSWWGLTV